MTVVTPSPFGCTLREQEVAQFLGLLDLPVPCAPTKAWLTLLIRRVLARIPYHNIGNIVQASEVPSIARIKQTMLTGLGGPCATMNPFLGALLDWLGYTVHLVAGSMDQLDCHIALLCHLEEGPHYVDVGDGKPYFTPMPIHIPTVYTYPYRTYRTRLEDGFLIVENKFASGWTFNCRVHLAPRTFASFDAIIHQHYTQPDFGPLLRGLRLAYFPQGTILAIKDDWLLSVEKGRLQRRKLLNLEDWKKTIDRCFSSLDLPILEAAIRLYPHLLSSSSSNDFTLS